MTRKDYELIAGVLRKHTESENYAERVGGRRIAFDLAEALAEADPRFDSKRFLAAALGEQ